MRIDPLGDLTLKQLKEICPAHNREARKTFEGFCRENEKRPYSTLADGAFSVLAWLTTLFKGREG